MLIVQGSARAQGFKGAGVALGLGLDIERSWVWISKDHGLRDCAPGVSSGRSKRLRASLA